MTYNGDVYYYIVNMFGDVLGIYDQYGTVVTEYVYDAWGYYVDVTGSMCYTLGFINPLRYRGYFFDEAVGYYYLQSRWYDPEVRRFLSADSYMVAGDHINSTNMFAYCLNNPVMYVDPSGQMSVFSIASRLFERYNKQLYLHFGKRQHQSGRLQILCKRNKCHSGSYF